MKFDNARQPRARLNTDIKGNKRRAAIARATRVEALEDRQLLSGTVSAAAQAALAKPAHIVIVVEEDRAANAIGDTSQSPYSDMPYFNQLASTGLVYNNSHGLNTTSQDGQMNYLALFSGSTQGVTDDSNNGVFNGPTLASTLAAAGLSFSGYSEGLPSAGDVKDNYAAEPGNPAFDDYYSRAFNPVAQFSNDGAGISNARVNQPFSAFPTTATGFAALPTVSFVIPSSLHNTHGSNDTDPYATDPSEYDILRQYADTWLQQNLNAYVQWAKQNNSLLIVTDDEGDRAHNFAGGFATIVAGSTNLFVPGVDTTNVTPYNILGTIEDMYGLTKLGSTATAADLDANAQGLLSAAPAAGQSASAAALSSSAPKAVAGQTVTFTATISPVAPATGTPTGSVNFMDGATLLGTSALNGSGVAAFSTVLAVGSHSITAVYGADTKFAASTSAVLAQTVARDATVTTVTTSATPAIVGQSVTFTATVSAAAPGSGVPTGSVKFMDGATLLGSTALDATGKATLTTSALSAASHPITAVYGDDTNFLASNSAPLTESIVRDATVIALASSANPAVAGQPVTFTATVSAAAPGSGTPTGIVNFMDGATLLGSAPLTGGVATFTTATLSMASHSITAAYQDDVNFAPSTSAPLVESVVRGATTTTLASSANPSNAGQSVTFTATVAPVAAGSSTPTGAVNFMDGATLLATAPLNGSGIATFTSAALSASSHSITATYVPDGNYAASVSKALAQSVAANATRTGLISSANPSGIGQNVTFTATVTFTASTTLSPTGTVNFMDGSTLLGSGTVNGAGIATFTTAALPSSIHTITAVYAGDANFTASTSPVVIQSIIESASISLKTSDSSTVAGQTVTLSVHVSAVAPAIGTPTGQVDIVEGATLIGMATLDGSGNASLTLSSLSVAAHTLTAEYLGDDAFPAVASSALTQVVSQDTTTTTLASSDDSSVAGEAITLTATVTADAPGSGTPTGTFQFMDGPTILATLPVDDSGSAVFTSSALSVATHPITVAYEDDANFASSVSPELDQAVGRDATTITLVSSDTTSGAGQGVTFTATVLPVAPGSGSPTGNVEFMDGATILGTVPLVGPGFTIYTSTSLAVGSHSITAIYLDDANFTGSISPALTQAVSRLTSTTTVSASANPIVAGQSVTFIATVSAGAGNSIVPTGNINFMDGSTVLGSVPLVGSGITSYTSSTFAVGTHHITAVYAGDSNFGASTSAAANVVVNRASTKTTLTASTLSSVAGQSVTFTAAVAPVAPGSGTPTGDVSFMDGSTVLATVPLVAGMTAYTSSMHSVASHTIKAVYADDVNFAASTSAAITETVKRDSTTTTLTSSANPSTTGQSITFTATVSANAPGSGTPSGSVKFMDGSTLLGTVTLSSGKAAFTTSKLSIASHTITAVYADDVNFAASTSAALTQKVTKVPTPANDNFADATVLSGKSITITGTNVNATKESGEPKHAGNAGGKSVWYTWTAPSSGTVSIDTHGSGFDTLLAVYTGQTVSALTAVKNGSNDDDPNFDGVTSAVQFKVTAGTVYRIAVDGYDGASGAITLHLTLS